MVGGGEALSPKIVRRLEEIIGARLVEGSSNGHLVVGLQMTVYSMNAAAAQIIADADGIGIDRGKLLLCRSTDQVKLMRALEAKDRKACVLMARRPSGRSPYSIVVMPVPLSPGLPPAAAMIVTDFERRALVRAELLAGLFGLSDAETRLAGAILQGKELSAIAKDLGKAEPTLRAQLRSIFYKAGVHRQLDFVRLALSLPTVRQW